jgi:hypothetical protein
MKQLSSFLTGLVLIHALVTAPIQVECISPDGHYLLELLGQDPCHAAASAALAGWNHSASDTSMCASDKEDPCVDLVLDSPGATQSCDDQLIAPHHVQYSSGTHQSAGMDGVIVAVSPGTGGRPPVLTCSEPFTRLTLRI